MTSHSYRLTSRQATNEGLKNNPFGQPTDWSTDVTIPTPDAATPELREALARRECIESATTGSCKIQMARLTSYLYATLNTNTFRRPNIEDLKLVESLVTERNPVCPVTQLKLIAAYTEFCAWQSFAKRDATAEDATATRKELFVRLEYLMKKIDEFQSKPGSIQGNQRTILSPIAKSALISCCLFASLRGIDDELGHKLGEKKETAFAILKSVLPVNAHYLNGVFNIFARKPETASSELLTALRLVDIREQPDIGVTTLIFLGRAEMSQHKTEAFNKYIYALIIAAKFPPVMDLFPHTISGLAQAVFHDDKKQYDKFLTDSGVSSTVMKRAQSIHGLQTLLWVGGNNLS